MDISVCPMFKLYNNFESIYIQALSFIEIISRAHYKQYLVSQGLYWIPSSNYYQQGYLGSFGDISL